MLDNADDNKNNNEVGMVEHQSMQRSALFPELSTVKFGIVLELPMDGPGGTFKVSTILGLVGRIMFLDQFVGPMMWGGGRGQCKGGAHAAWSTRGGGLRLCGEEDPNQHCRRDDDADTTPLCHPTCARPEWKVRQSVWQSKGALHWGGVDNQGQWIQPVPPSMTQRRKNVYCILDTGCSGMSVSPSLFDARYNAARANKKKGLWVTVDVKFVLLSGDIVMLSVKHPITMPLGNNERPWGKSLDGHGIIVLGLAFLDGMR
jgi:hypothetical protein